MKRGYYKYDDGEDVKKPGIFSKVDKWGLFKTCVKMVASGCASVVVNRYLKANLPEASNMFEKAAMGVGVYFITGSVSAAVSNYADKELEDAKSQLSLMEGGTDGGKPDKAS